MSAFSCCKRILIALFVIAVFVVLIHGWLTYKSYVFTHTAVSAIAVKYAAPKGRKLVTLIISDRVLEDMSLESRILEDTFNSP